MDKIDQQILGELTKDPQISFLRIAKKLRISPITVQRRFKKLKEEGIILQSSITIDLSKIGYQGKAHLEIINAPNYDKTTTVDALKQIKNVFIITEVTGEADVIAVLAVRDFKNLIDVINKIRKIPSVDQVEVTLTTDATFPVDKEFSNVLST